MAYLTVASKGKLILWEQSLDLRPSATSHSKDSHIQTSPAFSFTNQQHAFRAIIKKSEFLLLEN